MRRIKISKYDNEKFNNEAIKLLGMAFLFTAGTYSIKVILSPIGLSTLGSLFFYIIWAYCLMRVLLNNYGLLGKFIKVYVAALLTIFVSYYFFPYTQIYFIEYKTFLRQSALVFLPCAIITSQIHNFNNIFLILRKYAYVGFILMMIAYFMGYINYWGYQLWGVQLTPFVVIFYVNWIKDKSLHSFIIFVLSSLFVLMGGRQSLVILAICIIVLKFHYYFNKDKGKAILTIIIMGIGCIVLALLWDYILYALDYLLKIMNISSRTLSALINKRLFDTSNRKFIYDLSMEIIKKNGIKISGIFASLYHLRQFSTRIAYPHNIILEVLIDFGVLLGSILLCLLVFLIIRRILMGKYSKREFILALVILVICRLMVSSSYMIEGNFLILLGLLLNSKDEIHTNKRI